MNYKISIIIPILNEAETIAQLLQHLIDDPSEASVSEIILVDGGSTDGSQDIIQRFISNVTPSNTNPLQNTTPSATSFIDIRLIPSEKGRAKQMNTGAKHATGNVLYFLHADSFLPKHFDRYIIDEVKRGNHAGCFRMQFDSKHWWLLLASWLTQFRWRACRGGDQSQFITRLLFEDIGGYDERYSIYEDNMLINELFARNQFVVINKKLQTSARRYRKHGVGKLQFYFWMLYIKKWWGADADELLAYYKINIS
ncbi:TIGR04283 family arsenosugar biosynthesis glycosyltransferase [Gelidibacter salicanalis]|uniref:TIGR04283 family arsenosugar biosynthesis glycosyltransferase n=1 Tax=Gelidibacter salicanalis TaxID=291193 RepID=A0A934KRM5_9FLAO|nr:TIGR04283 family arsenosugar biosynthesis glycosyltransferase [Gelidibacter salicanalis]MBJ7880805.1 TIGR04283 family arsenosugar biosynthesis glycosyltransferase [Gelidibacter salicanalis]